MFCNRAALWSRPLTNALIAAALYSVVASPSAPHRPLRALDFADNDEECRLSLDLTPGKVVSIMLAVKAIHNEDGLGSGSDSYTQYSGDGTFRDGWPARSHWVSFVDM